MRFDEKVVVLTGVGREGQVGEAVAAAFARRGALLALVNRDEASATARARSLAGLAARAEPIAADLADPQGARTMAHRIEELFGPRVDALVQLAGGFGAAGPVAEDDRAIWDRMLAINLFTAVNSTRALLPFLRRARGAVVYTASESVLPDARIAGTAAYAAAKSGVVALMRAIAQEEQAHGVRANAIAPAAIRTAQNLADMGTGGPYVEREAVADVIVWLCSPQSTAINGQVVRLSPRDE
jgi:NAD(P)-dependent dehydrogenase (short-subunit alcohol dehydrogenase family)